MQQELHNFLEMLLSEKGASINTEKAYQRDIEQFLQAEKITNVTQITSKNISNFISLLASKNFAPKTQARKLSAIREFCKFLVSENIIQYNPSANIENPKLNKPLPKFLNETEMDTLIDTAKKHQDIHFRRLTTMLILMYHCGLRVSELVSLPLNAINSNKKQITILGKGAKERIIPISEAAIEEIDDYLTYREQFTNNKNNKWMFPSLSAKEEHISRDNFYKQLKKLAAMAGISPSRISPHVLRHSFATQLLRHQVNLRSLQKMLGHESINTTQIYTHIIDDELLKTIQKLHPLAQLK